MITLAIGADHRGYKFKQKLLQHDDLDGIAIEWFDAGTDSKERTDYPLYVPPVCDAVLDGSADAGILLCGSGQGMAIAANRYRGIYAALVWNETVAELAKMDDGTNVLVIPADFVSEEQAVNMVAAWLAATFKGGRYAERLEMIDS